ncbi:MAG: response regulator transcription factor [Oscillospiraceae bacterium]|jgi:DNA-binding response OmpR family regulator|nr:response regulator transcription factor [Oscillospiraceae bacterium]
MRLLIAEDEVDLAEALTVFFEKNHLSVDAVHNGFDAYEYASSGAYDAVILDVMMPKMDGIQVLEKLRQEGVKTPIMMLTAKGQKSDRITGFNAGADDYLPKPFDPDELLSRVRAILRRSEAYQPTVLAYGDLTLDPDSGNLSCGSESIRLSGREFQIMELFMRSPRQVFSAERIMERVWGWDNEAEINVVWVNISNLRKKLKSIGSHVTLQANRGLGYALEESV